MTGATRPWWLGAVALAVTVAAGAPADRLAGEPPQPRHQGSRPVAATSRRAPASGAAGGAIGRRDALTVARRFAAAYAAWDAGEHDSASARRLADAASAGLAQTIARQWARPAARPTRPLRLSIAHVHRGADGGYRVALVTADPPGVHIATLLVSATADGPRVVGLQR